MPRSLARWITTVGLLVLGSPSLGCGGGSDEPGSNAGLTVSQYCEKSAELICADLAACCGVTTAACIAKHRSGCEESGSNATSRGFSFDAAAAQRCVDATAGIYGGCVVPNLDTSSASSTCGLVFRPTLPPGASCTFDAACLGGEGTVGVCSSGKCAQVRLFEEGTPCEDSSEGVCASSAYCDATCRRRKSAGESCEGDVECSSGSCESRACEALPLATVCAALLETE